MADIEIECALDREQNSVSILLRDIPMERLDKVLHDISLESWRTNVSDGIRAQFIGGKSLGIPQTNRRFNVHDNEKGGDE
jgi:hypothetical protein